MKQVVTNIKKDIRHWSIFLITGIFFLLIGINMIFSPFKSYYWLTLILGLIILVTGALRILFSVRHNTIILSRRWILLIGVLDVLIGIMLFTLSGLPFTIIPFLIGCWILVNTISLADYFSALHLFNEPGWVWLIIGAVLTVICSLLLIISPVIGTITIMLWNGLSFIISGLFFIFLAFRLKRDKHRMSLYLK